MRQIEIEGKKYNLTGRLGQVTKLLKKYDIIALQNGQWGDDENYYIDFILESTWKLMQPKGIFKPFKFFFIFKRRVILEELLKGQKNVLGILYGLSEEKQSTIFEDEEDVKTQKKNLMTEKAG